MKVRKLIKGLYGAIVRHDRKKEDKIYQKITKKSLKGKNTRPIE